MGPAGKCMSPGRMEHLESPAAHTLKGQAAAKCHGAQRRHLVFVSSRLGEQHSFLEHESGQNLRVLELAGGHSRGSSCGRDPRDPSRTFPSHSSGSRRPRGVTTEPAPRLWEGRPRA